MKIIETKSLNVITDTCHASTIAYHPITNLPVFAWFGGTAEGAIDTAIYIQYKDDVIKLKKNPLAHWNPVLFAIDNKLFLSYKVGVFCDSWATCIVEITDIETVDIKELIKKEQDIPAGLNFCVKTKPIIEHNRLFCGASVETRLDWTSYVETWQYRDDKFEDHFEFLDRSFPLTVKKELYTFQNYNIAYTSKTLGIIQPALWMDKTNKIRAIFRSSRGLGNIYYSEIYDGAKPQSTVFKNPNSSVDIVNVSDRLFMVYNPSERNRYPLIVSELDNSLNVVDELTVADMPSKDCYSPEFSYPYIIEKNDILHLTYTKERTGIEYVQISI